MNFSYEPAFTRIGGTWQQDNPIEISLSSTAIAGNAFLGFFSGRALYIGPSLFVRLSDAITVKVAWEAQIPAETAGRDELATNATKSARNLRGIFELYAGTFRQESCPKPAISLFRRRDLCDRSG